MLYPAKKTRVSSVSIALFAFFIFGVYRLQSTDFREDLSTELSDHPIAPRSFPSNIQSRDRPAKETNFDHVSEKGKDIDSASSNEGFAAASSTKPSKTVRFCDKHNETDVGPCIFDVGLNTGQDTIQYLKSPKSRVVALEANPHLIDDAKEKLRDEVNAGRLKLLNIGLVGNASETSEKREKLTFWINTHNSKFSSFKQTTGCRDPAAGAFLPEGNTTFCRKIEMDTMSCSELIEEYGTPIYMKVDIEGMDRACLQALANIPKKDRPKYLSKENVFTYDIQVLSELGYTAFKVVNQKNLQHGLWGSELDGHSGPWGEDAQDVWLGKKWHSREEIMARLPLPNPIVVRGQNVTGWFDIHGKK